MCIVSNALLTVDFGAFAMDRITTEQRDAIKKTSTERLSARLQQVGWSVDDVAVLDRELLIQTFIYRTPCAAIINKL